MWKFYHTIQVFLKSVCRTVEGLISSNNVNVKNQENFIEKLIENGFSKSLLIIALRTKQSETALISVHRLICLLSCQSIKFTSFFAASPPFISLLNNPNLFPPLSPNLAQGGNLFIYKIFLGVLFSAEQFQNIDRKAFFQTSCQLSKELFERLSLGENPLTGEIFSVQKWPDLQKTLEEISQLLIFFSQWRNFASGMGFFNRESVLKKQLLALRENLKKIKTFLDQNLVKKEAGEDEPDNKKENEYGDQKRFNVCKNLVGQLQHSLKLILIEDVNKKE